MYLKRQQVPKSWPISRKGTAYLVRPKGSIKDGIPLLIVLRDILKITQNRTETKKAINSGLIMLNGGKIRDERISLCLFDVISIVPEKKYYQLILTKNKKFDVEEIKENDSKNKIAKITNKRTLKGKKVQLNLSDGRNFLSTIKCNVNDSVLINFKDKKIEKCLPLKEKEKAIVFSGKHAGKRGIIEKIDTKNKMIELKGDEEKINVLIKHMMVIE